MFKVLNAHRCDGRIYWNIGLLMLSSSVSFRMSCLKRIEPRWYKSLPWSKVKHMLKKYSNLEIRNYIYKQVMIPKTDGSLRPLGVPAPEWRLLLAGLNMLLLVYLSLYQHPNQHGYLPLRGTDTAWSQMEAEILNKKFIYDFDLMKFFDSVDLTNLSKLLKRTEMPEELIRAIIGWNRVPPQNVDRSTNLTWTTDSEKQTSVEGYGRLDKESRKYYESLELRKDWAEDYGYYHGVAQGSAISPTLSTLVLIPELLLKEDKGITAIMYADDGKLASNNEFCPEDELKFTTNSGIKVHSDGRKNGWDRYAGEWYQDSKFFPPGDRKKIRTI